MLRAGEGAGNGHQAAGARECPHPTHLRVLGLHAVVFVHAVCEEDDSANEVGQEDGEGEEERRRVVKVRRAHTNKHVARPKKGLGKKDHSNRTPGNILPQPDTLAVFAPALGTVTHLLAARVTVSRLSVRLTSAVRAPVHP